MPQEYVLFPHLSVGDNIGYGLHNLSKDDKLIARALEWVELSEFGERMPDQISGGERQRIALARVIALIFSSSKPFDRLLLLDEPLSAQDGPMRTNLRSKLRNLLVEHEIPTILVTHDRMEAAALSDSVAVIKKGRILQHGTIETVFYDPIDAVEEIIGTLRILNVAESEDNPADNYMLTTEEGGKVQVTTAKESSRIIIDARDVSLNSRNN